MQVGAFRETPGQALRKSQKGHLQQVRNVFHPRHNLLRVMEEESERCVTRLLQVICHWLKKNNSLKPSRSSFSNVQLGTTSPPTSPYPDLSPSLHHLSPFTLRPLNSPSLWPALASQRERARSADQIEDCQWVCGGWSRLTSRNNKEFPLICYGVGSNGRDHPSPYPPSLPPHQEEELVSHSTRTPVTPPAARRPSLTDRCWRKFLFCKKD